eukprot:420748_1
MFGTSNMRSMLQLRRSIIPIANAQWNSLKYFSTTTTTQLKQIPGDTSIDRTAEMFDREDPMEFYNKLQAENPNDSMVKFKFLNIDHVISYDNTTARQLLGLEARGLAKDIFPAHWGLLLGPKAISNLSGKEHLEIRKAYRPAFTHNVMDGLTPTIAQITLNTMDAMYNECNKTNDFIEVGSFTLRWQWNIGIQTLFGNNFLTHKQSEELHSLFEIYVMAFTPRDGKGFEEGSQIYNGVQAYEKLKIFIRDNIIAKAREMHAEKILCDKSLIHKMITTAGQPALTETETFCPLDSTLFLMFAAHHTTATGAAAMLNHLGGNPHIVDKLNNELIETFGEDIDLINIDYD